MGALLRLFETCKSIFPSDNAKGAAEENFDITLWIFSPERTVEELDSFASTGRIPITRSSTYFNYLGLKGIEPNRELGCLKDLATENLINVKRPFFIDELHVHFRENKQDCR